MKKREVDVLGNHIFKNLMLFTVPVALTGILQLLYNAADVMVVGRYAGSNSLAAVGATSSLINLLVNLIIGLSVGTNVCVARFLGMGKSAEKEIKKSVHTSIYVALLGGVILATVSIIFAKPLLHMMATPENIIDEATLYMDIIFLGMPAILVYNFGAAILRAMGDAKTPLVILSMSGILNIILNLFFVICFHMGAEGVGIATTASQIMAAVMVLSKLHKVNSPCRFRFKELKIDFNILKRIIKIGLPAGVQGLVFNISNVQIQSAINSFGSAVIAGNSSACTIENFVYTATNATYQALITFVGQNAGAGKFEKVKRITLTGLLQVTMIGVLTSGLFLLTAKPLLSLYTPGDFEVINYGFERLIAIMPYQVLCGLMEAIVGASRGLGASFVPMLVTVLGVCGFRMTWLLFLFPKVHTLNFVYISYPISWIITGALQFICFAFIYNKEKKRISAREM